jgi:tetratricopeptide (TPR) repeat protein
MSQPEVEKMCHLGRELLMKKEIDAAMDAFNQAISLDPDSCEAHEGLANSAYLSGDLARAVSEYQKLTLLNPTETRFLTNLGAIHNRLGEHMKACDYLRKAIARNKKCAESFYNLGIAQRKLKQNSMAVSAYKEAIKLDPMMAEAYQNLGNVYVDMGNLQMAIANFKKALEIKPSFEKARVGLEKAEQQLIESRNRNNPMDRLNAMSSTVTTIAPVTTRELRDDERYEDRKCVKDLADEIERLSRGCVEYLKHNVMPAILEVERAMAHGTDEVSVLAHAAAAFKNASVQWSALRRSLKRKIADLAAHEQMLNAPAARS